MGYTSKTFLLLHLLTLLQWNLTLSKSFVNTIPGFDGQLPFTFETGYVGLGEKDEIQLFYYFVESERDPNEDPFIFYITGGPGASAVYSFFNQIGPLSFIFGDAYNDTTLTVNPNSWTKMANVLFVDLPAGTGFSYATTKEGWYSSDSIVAKQSNEFLKKFLIDHPKFLKNPLYIAGISYMGLIVPLVTLEAYNANERGEQPTLNIQGYFICSPLTDKFKDFNSRLEYAFRTALISYDIYKGATENCNGDYVNKDRANSICLNSLQSFDECTSRINVKNILDPFCEADDLKPYCIEYYEAYIIDWANHKDVQQALYMREGTIGTWELINSTLHYVEGKNDSSFYAYDIRSSFVHHKELLNKTCRALIYNGDHDMTFPYVGVLKWIDALNLTTLDRPWEPFYVDNQVGGYSMGYSRDSFSLTYGTIKGGGHSVPLYKPKEAVVLLEKWLGGGTSIYSS